MNKGGDEAVQTSTLVFIIARLKPPIQVLELVVELERIEEEMRSSWEAQNEPQAVEPEASVWR